jgi:hypothetical protein
MLGVQRVRFAASRVDVPYIGGGEKRGKIVADGLRYPAVGRAVNFA